MGLVPDVTQTHILQDLQRRASSGKENIHATAAQGEGDWRKVSADQVGRRPNVPPCPTLHKSSRKPVPNTMPKRQRIKKKLVEYEINT